jgi:hypothetical protein
MPYTLPCGTILPSVTEILAATESPDKKQRLAEWNLENPGVGEQKCDRGSAVHAAAANYLLQPQPRLPADWRFLPFGKTKEREYYRALYQSHLDSVPEFALDHYRSTLPYLMEIGECYWVEHQVGGVHEFVWSKLGYAGRPDIVAMVDDCLTLIDIKTCDEPYSPTWKNKAGYAKFCKAATQLAAYNLAVRETLGLKPERLAILVALSDRYQLLEVNRKAGELAEKRWHKRLKQFQKI